MAQIKNPIHGTGPVNAGEQRLIDYLHVRLPDDYLVIPNGEIPVQTKPGVVQPMEFDCIVIAPHAIYHIENKDIASQITADDFSWQFGGKSIPNPLKTAKYKSDRLRTKMVMAHPEWQRTRWFSLITLSHPNQSKYGFDPYADATKVTFTLNQDLIEYLTDADKFGLADDAISEYQHEMASYLTGHMQHNQQRRTHVSGKKIIAELERNDDYVEYLCEDEMLIGTGRTYRVKEYALDVAGLSPMQLEQRKLKVNNGNIAQNKIGTSPYILPSQYVLDAEQTHLYEITEDLGTRSLANRMRQSTMTFMAKIKIIQDIAHALKAAHKENVFHRNVSPENICVMPDGSAALTNFSQAWYAEHTTAGGPGFTVRSQVVTDKSPYCLPEFSDDDVCAASDLFSLGVVAYQLLTDKLPFESTFMFKAMGALPESKLPSKVVSELPEWIDALIKQTIALDTNDRFGTAEELIDYINTNAFQISSGGTTSGEHRQKTLREIKVGDMVTPGVQLYEELGKGGFGRVFKAKNTVNGRYFAIKLFDYSPSSIQDVISEYNALSGIEHKNVVKIQVCDKSLDGLFYTQMELLEGDNLGAYTKGDLKLPLSEIYKMASEILSALVHMQEMPGGPMYHRDIKPNNIVWDKKNRYVLIDFNIATSTSDNSFAGTQPYMAPDLVKSSNRIEWDKSADTFSLGVTLYELLTHTYPWPGSDPCPRMNIPATDIKSVSNHDFSDEFANFVMRSIITNNQQRFTTAREMLEALEAIGPEGMLRKISSEGVVHVNLTTGTETDIVDYLNSLYSQSEHGNSGTRAAVKPSALDDLTYTQTKLDKKLLKDIADLKYKLVIITGNAGDGKTAFLHKVEQIDSDREILNSSNGAKFHIKGVPFESNYDGSQDEEEKANDEVLREFFAPFIGLEDLSQANQGRVIAINEGRLVDFLSTQPELKNLERNIEDYFYKEGHVELMPGLMVINLNLRSVTAHEGKEDSLLKSQIKKLTQPHLWKKCDKCPIADKCFIKYNVDTLNDESAGDEVINRLEWLLRTIVYKRELHVTMRDLRSFISFLITRDYNCEQVKQMIAHMEADNMAPEFYWQFYYFNITAPAFYYNKYFPFPTNDSADRLVRLLKETDLAKVSLPSFDRDLYYNKMAQEDYLTFSSRKRSLLAEFDAQNIIRPYYDMTEDDKLLAQARHSSMIRHQYFEGQWRHSKEEKDKFMMRLPYQSISAFHDQLGSTAAEKVEECKRSIATAISKSEGCLNDELSSRYMLLSCSHINDPLSKSYRMFPLSDFELFVNATPHLTEYIEYESDSLTFRHKTDHDIQLTVSLDLFEMLSFIKKGFNPSVNDLQGRFIELQIFKNRLESKTYKEILVTKNNKKFSVVRLNEDKTITIEPYNQPQQ